MMRKIRKSLLAIMLAVFCVLGLSSCVKNKNYEDIVSDDKPEKKELKEGAKEQ